jgi:hypothetical protein
MARMGDCEMKRKAKVKPASSVGLPPESNEPKHYDLDITELFCAAIQSGRVRLVDLVEALSKPKGPVSLILRIQDSMDIRDISDVALSLGAQLNTVLVDRRTGEPVLKPSGNV